MWRINPPTQTASACFRVCTSRVRDQDLKKRLRGAEEHIIASDLAYVAAAKTTSLHALKAGKFSISPEVADQELIRIYEDRMARKGSAGREIYDELILAAKDGRCPLCGQRQVSTLDHHLPKSLFPTLAVNPNNLVPACADCNKLKLDAVPMSSEQETLHPYFDNIEDVTWLKAGVIEVAPAALRFYVEPPASWSSITALRVERHFKTFKLGKLYAAQSAYELSNIRFYLEQVYSASSTGGRERVRKHLEDQAESRRRANVNSWQTATYQALAKSDWYCDGGFSV